MHRPQEGGSQAETQSQHFVAFRFPDACVTLKLTLFLAMNKFYPH